MTLGVNKNFFDKLVDVCCYSTNEKLCNSMEC